MMQRRLMWGGEKGGKNKIELCKGEIECKKGIHILEEKKKRVNHVNYKK